jgi:hypothetical protein
MADNAATQAAAPASDHSGYCPCIRPGARRRRRANAATQHRLSPVSTSSKRVPGRPLAVSGRRIGPRAGMTVYPEAALSALRPPAHSSRAPAITANQMRRFRHVGDYARSRSRRSGPDDRRPWRHARPARRRDLRRLPSSSTARRYCWTPLVSAAGGVSLWPSSPRRGAIPLPPQSLRRLRPRAPTGSPAGRA